MTDDVFKGLENFVTQQTKAAADECQRFVDNMLSHGFKGVSTTVKSGGRTFVLTVEEQADE